MIAPDPYLAACLATIRTAVLLCRAGHWTKELSHEHAAALMDAVHNIPYLLQNWETCDVQRLRADLEDYDNTWGHNPAARITLLGTFDNCVLGNERG